MNMNKSKHSTIKQLYDNFFEDLVNIINAIIKNRFDAEDIVSEVFEKYMRQSLVKEVNYKNILSDCKIEAERILIAKNKFIDKSVYVICNSPEEMLINAERRKVLESRICNFKRTYSRALELHYLHEMRPCQVARELCIKRNTATRKISRGTALLKDYLIKKGYR